MAPGPHVKMLEGKPMFENSEENIDPDEEFNVFTYYPSKKILSKLFRAIDERSIFEYVQQNKPDHRQTELWILADPCQQVFGATSLIAIRKSFGVIISIEQGVFAASKFRLPLHSLIAVSFSVGQHLFTTNDDATDMKNLFLI